MYVNGEFVPMPLIIVLGLMILTVFLVKWGERAQYRSITPRRKLAIQLAAIAPLCLACGISIMFVIANYNPS